jgi:DGQHR domain-containing protein
MDEVRVKAIRVSQPIGDFYIGVIEASALVAISYADVRDMERTLDKYLGIQRRLSERRKNEIAEYVKTSDATFPTSVLLAVRGDVASWSEEDGILTLRQTESVPFGRIGKILDGQHRVAGLRDYTGPTFEVPVSIFVDADIADQANIFATVNLAQTKVNKSLVYDLFDYQKARSPQKTAHDIAVAFDEHVDGPFYRRIKRLGYATAGRPKEMLTQATVVEELMKLITRDKTKDRDLLLNGKSLPIPDSAELRKHPFRKLFIDENDLAIARCVHNFFIAVREKWPEAWRGHRQGQILPKTNGFKALMSFLRRAYLEIVGADIGRVVTVDEYRTLLERVELSDADFTVDRFAPGSSGQAALKRQMDQGLKKLGGRL